MSVAYEFDDEQNDICRVERWIQSGRGLLFAQEVSPIERQRKEVIIFVHGNTFPARADFDLPVSGYSLAGFLAERGQNCCYFDHRGYGRSYKPRRGESVGIDQRVEDLEAIYEFVTRKLGAQAVILVGLSTGCNTIARFLKKERSKVRGTVFLGPCYLVNSYMQVQTRRISLLKTIRAMWGRVDDYLSMSSNELFNRIYKNEAQYMDKDVVKEFIRVSMSSYAPGADKLVSPVLAFPELLKRREPWAPMFDVEQIKRPLLVLRGRNDEICCQITARKLVENVKKYNPDVHLVTFENKKHDMHLYRDHFNVFQEIFEFVNFLNYGGLS